MATQFAGGARIPTNFIWDVQRLNEVDVNTPQFKELLVRLYQNLNLMANVINAKETGLFDVDIILNGQSWFPNPNYSSTTAAVAKPRSGLRLVINFGALPNTGTKSVAHGIDITANTVITHLYGAATNPSTSFIPIPYASPTSANNIELNMDAMNINITTGSNRSAYTTTFVVINYLQT